MKRSAMLGVAVPVALAVPCWPVYDFAEERVTFAGKIWSPRSRWSVGSRSSTSFSC